MECERSQSGAGLASCDGLDARSGELSTPLRAAISGTPPRLLVIGVGNAYRRDDAVGLLVARAVQAHGLPGVTVMEASGDGASLLEQWADAETVLLVDAVRAGAAPGSIHRIDLNRCALPPAAFISSTHTFGVAQAVEMARLLQRLPRRLILWGVEGEDFRVGTCLSPAVQHALGVVTLQVLAECRSLCAARGFAGKE